MRLQNMRGGARLKQDMAAHEARRGALLGAQAERLHHEREHEEEVRVASRLHKEHDAELELQGVSRQQPVPETLSAPARSMRLESQQLDAADEGTTKKKSKSLKARDRRSKSPKPSRGAKSKAKSKPK